MNRLKDQAGGITVNIFLLLIVVVGASFMWQRATDKEASEIANLESVKYTSPFGEFQITIPKGWSLGDGSVEDQGIILLEILGPRNTVVNNAFTSGSDVESQSIEEAFGNERYNELINSSVGREYILVQVEVLTAASYDLPLDKEQWKIDLLASDNTASGIAVGEIEDFSATGASGYKYQLTLFESEQTLEATSYYLLGNQAEIVIFPHNSNFNQESEAMIKSMVFTTDQETLEALEEL